MRVRELLNLIPDEILENISEECRVDKANQQLTGKVMFKILLFSLAETTRISLRTIERIYNSAIFSQFIGNEKQCKPKHSSFADRLGKIKPSYFATIFDHLVQAYQSKIPKKMHNNIYRFDGTLIGLSSKLFHFGLKCGATYKDHFKVVIGLKGLIPASVYFCKTSAEVNENVAITNAIVAASVSKDDIIVFDRGMQKTRNYVKLTESELTFVTRIRLKRIFRLVNDIPITPFNADNIISDQKIIMTEGNHEFTSTFFRAIRVKQLNEEEDLLLLTNNFTLSSEEVSEIYKRRWDIEVFFRFIKQELNMKHFLARNVNGLMVHIYMILIFSILLLIYKTTNKLQGFKFVKWDFFHELEIEIISDIIYLCKGDPGIFLSKHGMRELMT